jgi:hypothetical protein
MAVRMLREESASIDCRDYNLPIKVQLRNATWLYACAERRALVSILEVVICLRKYSCAVSIVEIIIYL